jgi:hypothetical protein
MADKPCNTCKNYDAITVRDGKDVGRHGRCAVKSTYPAVEQQGQTFPPGVKRVAPGERAKPEIVVGEEVIPACTLYRSKK